MQLVDAVGAPADLVALGDPTTYDDLCRHDGLRAVARYADVVGIARTRLLDRPRLVDDAHLAGLQVLAWTVRDDDPGGRSWSRPRSGRCWTRVSTGCSATTPTRPCWSATSGPPSGSAGASACCGCGPGAATGLTPRTSTSFGTITQATR